MESAKKSRGAYNTKALQEQQKTYLPIDIPSTYYLHAQHQFVLARHQKAEAVPSANKIRHTVFFGLRVAGARPNLQDYIRLVSLASTFCTRIYINVSNKATGRIQITTKDAMTSHQSAPMMKSLLHLCKLIPHKDQPPENHPAKCSWGQYISLPEYDDKLGVSFIEESAMHLSFVVQPGSTNLCDAIHAFAFENPTHKLAREFALHSAQYQRKLIEDFVSASVNEVLHETMTSIDPYGSVDDLPGLDGKTKPEKYQTIARGSDFVHQTLLQCTKLVPEFLTAFLDEEIISAAFYKLVTQDTFQIRALVVNALQQTMHCQNEFKLHFEKRTHSSFSVFGRPNYWEYAPSLNQQVLDKADTFRKTNQMFLPFDELPQKSFVEMLLISRALFEYANNIQSDNNGRSLVFFGLGGTGKTSLCRSLGQVFSLAAYDCHAKSPFQTEKLAYASVYMCDELTEKNFTSDSFKPVLDFENQIEVNTKYGSLVHVGKGVIRVGTTNVIIDDLVCDPNLTQRNTRDQIMNLRAILRRVMPLDLELTEANYKWIQRPANGQASAHEVETIKTIFLLGWIINGFECEAPFPQPHLPFEFDADAYNSVYEEIYEQLTLSQGNYVLKRFAALMKENSHVRETIRTKLKLFAPTMQTSYTQNIDYLTKAVTTGKPPRPVEVRTKLISDLSALLQTPTYVDTRARAAVCKNFEFDLECEEIFDEISMTKLGSFVLQLTDSNMKTQVYDAITGMQPPNYLHQMLSKVKFTADAMPISQYVKFVCRYQLYYLLSQQFTPLGLSSEAEYVIKPQLHGQTFLSIEKSGSCDTFMEGQHYGNANETSLVFPSRPQYDDFNDRHSMFK